MNVGIRKIIIAAAKIIHLLILTLLNTNLLNNENPRKSLLLKVLFVKLIQIFP
ncbi:hypothetical protein LZD60_06405 [Clostridium perfringens]|nr:hypothetical protein LZD60_06405 [Clostridium perfringens]